MMELDLYWIAHAGVSPVHILDRSLAEVAWSPKDGKDWGEIEG